MVWWQWLYRSGLLWNGDASHGWCLREEKCFGAGRILLHAFAMTLELGIVNLFTVAITVVFDYIIVVQRAVCCDFSFVIFSIGRSFANDGPNGKQS